MRHGGTARLAAGSPKASEGPGDHRTHGGDVATEQQRGLLGVDLHLGQREPAALVAEREVPLKIAVGLSE